MNPAFYLLALSALCEAIWNVFLTQSKGLWDWSNNILGALALLAGIFLFKKALDRFPLSVSIIVWSGLSLIGTVLLDVWLFHTKMNMQLVLLMLLCLAAILALSYYAHAQH